MTTTNDGFADAIVRQDEEDIARLKELLRQARQRRRRKHDDADKARARMDHARQDIADACTAYQTQWNLLVKEHHVTARTLRAWGILPLESVCADERRKAQAALNPTKDAGPTDDGPAATDATEPQAREAAAGDTPAQADAGPTDDGAGRDAGPTDHATAPWAGE